MAVEVMGSDNKEREMGNHSVGNKVLIIGKLMTTSQHSPFRFDRVLDG
jgi:hypothetical protein